MKDRGELLTKADAPERDDMSDPAFWEKAEVLMPQKSKSVHLRLDPEVFDYFYRISGGKGHLTRMQAVLKAYVTAQQK